MKLRNWKGCLAVAMSLSCSLPSSPSFAFMGIEESTLPAQMLQLTELKLQVDKLSQALLNTALGPQIQAAIQQMTGTHNDIMRVVSTDTQFRDTDYDTLTPEQVLALRERRREERKMIRSDLENVRNKLVTDKNKHRTLSSGLALINEPESNIQATQAVALNQVADQEHAWVETGISLIDHKLLEIDDAYALDEEKQNEALNRCIVGGDCGST